jgi:hypothetical protein
MPLVVSAATYWDPSLLSLPADVRPTKLLVARRDNTYTLVRDDGSWKLTTPVQAPADGPQVGKILRDMTNLTAEKVVYLGNEVPEQYAKAVHNLTVEVSGRKVLDQAQSRPGTQPTSAGSESAPASAPAASPAEAPSPATAPAPAASSAPATAAAESAPASQPATGPAMGPEAPVGKVQFVKLEEKTYAWLPGQKPLAIGEFPGSLYDDLAAELRQRSVWHVEANDVIGVKLLSGPERMELRREGEDWVNVLNPDEKVDAEKVQTFLGDVKDISAERFMTYQNNPADAEKLGLVQPWATLEIRLAGGKSLTLTVSARGQDKTENRYASGGTVEGIFVLPAETIGKLAKKLSDFRKSAPKPAEGVQ